MGVPQVERVRARELIPERPKDARPDERRGARKEYFARDGVPQQEVRESRAALSNVAPPARRH